MPDKASENHGALPIHGSVIPVTPRLLDLANAARYLGVSPWVVRDLEHAGRLKRVRLDLGGRDVRRLLFDLHDLDRLIDRSKE